MNGRNPLRGGIALCAAVLLAGLRAAAPLPTLALMLVPAVAAAQDESESGIDEDREVERDDDTDRENEIESDRESERESGMEEERGDEALRGDSGFEVEPDVVLAIDLSKTGLRIAHRLGYRVEDQETLPELGFRLTQLATPGGLPPEAAVRQLRQADPSGVYDVNSRYVSAGQAPCEGIRCDPQKMVGWPISGCATPVRIGIADTAVAYGNPALAGRDIEQRHFGDLTDRSPQADHGSEIASILLGNAYAGVAGLLPKATLLAADVFKSGSGRMPSTDALLIARGLNWLVSKRAQVINIAIEGPDNAVLRRAVSRVVGLGTPVVAAAGNLGPQGPPRYPAAYPEVIAVTAVDRKDRIYARANHGDYIDLAAPGVHIWSADALGLGRFVDGTSFATPFVSAAVALLRQSDPSLTPAQIQQALRRTAMVLDGGHQPQVFGAGLLRSHICSAPVPMF